MEVNFDVDRNAVVSYDVLMDSGEGIVTMLRGYVEADVEHARTHSVSYDRRGGTGRLLRRGPRTGRRLPRDGTAGDSNMSQGGSENEHKTGTGAEIGSGGEKPGSEGKRADSGHTTSEGRNAGVGGARGKDTTGVGGSGAEGTPNGGDDGRDDAESEGSGGSDYSPNSDESEDSFESTRKTRKRGERHDKCRKVNGNLRSLPRSVDRSCFRKYDLITCGHFPRPTDCRCAPGCVRGNRREGK